LLLDKSGEKARASRKAQPPEELMGCPTEEEPVLQPAPLWNRRTPLPQPLGALSG
jgi:hypothetical protein